MWLLLIFINQSLATTLKAPSSEACNEAVVRIEKLNTFGNPNPTYRAVCVEARNE